MWVSRSSGQVSRSSGGFQGHLGGIQGHMSGFQGQLGRFQKDTTCPPQELKSVNAGGCVDLKVNPRVDLKANM